ncbi:MAG TPA: aminoacyl-tRNA hydrolase [Spirochaetia bacterium]|nr:MAG: aminoacyl-tRNA hydrolase [Spirochaetes bacterium GWB1_36_13]HCL56387.1 aminoacyl-tRNA hydrolase [Spirochaetia bacterium]
MIYNQDILFVGLGNPGQQYKATRHNIGFRLIEKITSGLNIKMREKNNYALISHPFENKTIYFLKPMMYMNLSGISTLHVASYYKIPSENIITAYDDIALPLGKLRIRTQGSAGGHNGIKSLIENLGKDNFIRIRLGIGENKNIPLEKYVLTPFPKESEEDIEAMLVKAEEAFWDIIRKGPETTMNLFN